MTNETEYLVYTCYSYIHISGELESQIFCLLCWVKDVYFLITEFWTFIM